jgi:heme a synthase
MPWTWLQKSALAAFLAVVLLIFVGATVRATGSGLGCPDWPLCYGQYIPPTHVDQIDFSRLNLEKFRQKAARLGRDPATITPESIRAEFDPVATWIEYINRLTSLPVSLTVLALFIVSFREFRHRRARVFFAAFCAVALVGINAWLGARVVLSGLKPGTITLHMALAILLLCVLVYAGWRGCDRPWRLHFHGSPTKLKWIALTLFVLIVIEGMLGSQVRELTDELAKLHAGERREQWVWELEQTWVYLFHRSFSWVILGLAFAFYFLARRQLTGRRWLEAFVLGLVLAQMVLGLVLSHFGILRIAQILHIGLSSLLVSGLFLWLLGAFSRPRGGDLPLPSKRVMVT